MSSDREFSGDSSSITNTEDYMKEDEEVKVDSPKRKAPKRMTSALTLAALNVANTQANEFKRQKEFRNNYEKTYKRKLDPKWKRDINTYLNKMILFVMNKIDISIRNEPDIIILKSMISIYLIKNNFEALWYISQLNDRQLNTQG